MSLIEERVEVPARKPTLSDIRWEGMVTAVSPISHGDGTLGTTTLFRRGKVVQPGGVPERVPLVSGNGVRGVLRRMSSDTTRVLLGNPMWEMPTFQAMTSGGSLTKTSSPLKSGDIQRIRDLVPHLSLFGFAAGGRIVSGRTRVAEMIPVCVETAHILPPALAGHPHLEVSAEDLLENREFSRLDETGGSTRMGQISGGAVAADDSTNQMRFGAQLVAAGTVFSWGLDGDALTPVERAHLVAALNLWAEHGCVVGGRSAAGLGRLQVELDGWSSSSRGEVPALLAEHYTSHSDEISEVLGWLS